MRHFQFLSGVFVFLFFKLKGFIYEAGREKSVLANKSVMFRSIFEAKINMYELE